MPYSGDNLMAVAMRHVRDPVPSVRALRPDVPERVDAVVARAMAKRPEDRFGSMAALAAALEACLAEVEPGAAGGPDEDTGCAAAPALSDRGANGGAAPRRRRRRSPRRRRSGLRVAAVLLLAAVILVGNLLVLEIVFEDGLPGSAAAIRRPCRSTRSPTSTPTATSPSIPSRSAAATDRDTASFWTTEEYRASTRTASGSCSTPAAASRSRASRW